MLSADPVSMPHTAPLYLAANSLTQHTANTTAVARATMDLDILHALLPCRDVQQQITLHVCCWLAAHKQVHSVIAGA